MWLGVICVIQKKIMWAVGLSRSFGILQEIILLEHSLLHHEQILLS